MNYFLYCKVKLCSSAEPVLFTSILGNISGLPVWSKDYDTSALIGYHEGGCVGRHVANLEHPAEGERLPEPNDEKDW